MQETNKSTTAPAILIVLAVVIMLIGVGRCGFFQPLIHPRMDDYGLGGACCLLLGLALLINGFVWLTRRKRS